MFRLKALVRSAIVIAIIAAILFAAAGRYDLPFFWAYLALLAGFVALTMLTVSRELLEERKSPGGKGRDNLVLLRVAAGVSFLFQWVFAGLDVGRFHWTDSVSTPLRALGLVGFFGVLAIWHWAMRTNPFFSAAVRIQHDRGHFVVASGPYRIVRHPGYAAFVLLGWGGPLALGSWGAAVSHLVVVLLFVRRAMLEDRMLRTELDGYAAYAARVRYRFLPGVW